MKENFDKFKQFIKGKNVAVVGIGVSNIPLIRFLVKLGAKVTAFDKREEEKLKEIAGEFKDLGVKLVLGDNYMDSFLGYDVIFKTPSVRADHIKLVEAKEKGAIITSEMEEFIKYCPAKVFGVTGSDGKTTTTTLIYEMLKEEGYKTFVGGNIGTPLFSIIEEIKPEHKVVLELSSFQLMTMNHSPQVSVVTNLSPNHLDMHKSMEEYIEAKENIFKFQEPEDMTVLNKDNTITNSMLSKLKGKHRMFSIKEKVDSGAYFKDDKLYVNDSYVCNKSEIKLIGMHNIENLLASFTALYGDVSIESMKKVATEFTGVAHRCELVRTLNGVTYYNDSIATSPTRTLAGLKSFTKPVILIAGGYDKKIPFDVLAKEGNSKIKTLILMGATRFKLKEAFDLLEKKTGKKVPIIMVETLEEAVKVARDSANIGDIVTLSPACASFDAYVNFEERGNEYRDLVNSLI